MLVCGFHIMNLITFILNPICPLPLRPPPKKKFRRKPKNKTKIGCFWGYILIAFLSSFLLPLNLLYTLLFSPSNSIQIQISPAIIARKYGFVYTQIFPSIALWVHIMPFACVILE